MALLLGTIIALLAVTASGRVRLDVAALGALGVLAVGGVLKPAEAVSGFAADATLTVAAMLALVEGLRRCGVTDALGRWLGRLAQAGRGRALGALCLLTALASSFASDVGMVALLIPILTDRGAPWSPRRALLPAAVAAALGSTLTLVGSSSNLVANQFLAQGTSGHGLGLFALAPVGAAVVAAGLVAALLAGRFLEGDESDERVPDLEALRPYLADVRVAEDSPLDGKPLGRLADLGLRALRLERGGLRVANLRPDLTLHAGDHLTVSGDRSDLLEKGAAHGLEVAGEATDVQSLEGDGLRVVEAVIPETSGLAGRSLRREDFRRRSGLTVLAVRRHGRLSGTQLAEIRLGPGDLLLLLGSPEDVQRQARSGVIVPLAGVELAPRRLKRAPLAIGILAAALLAGSVGPLRPVIALGAGVVAMLVSGCLRPDEMYEALDWRVIISVAALIPLGTAVSSSGLGHLVASSLAAWTRAWPPVALLAVTDAFTALLSQGIHHTAAAAVAAPLAVALAQARHLSPVALVVGVIVAASASPMTPICNKVNLLVMEPGGYRWRDYAMVGVPVALAAGAVSILVIPWLWPLTAGR